jgi:hypothetical protein
MEHRAFRLGRHLQALQAQQALQEGRTAAFSTQLTPEQRCEGSKGSGG